MGGAGQLEDVWCDEYRYDAKRTCVCGEFGIKCGCEGATALECELESKSIMISLESAVSSEVFLLEFSIVSSRLIDPD